MPTYTWIGSAKQTPGAADSSMLLEVRRRALVSQGAVLYRSVNPTKPLLNYPVIPRFTNNEDTYSEKRILAQGNPVGILAPIGSTSDNPFVADFTGASATTLGPTLFRFGDSVDYDVQSGTIFVRLDNIPVGTGNPGGTALIKIFRILIEFNANPVGNIQSPTFVGPAVPTSNGPLLPGPPSNTWGFVFALPAGTPIGGFEGVPFSFQTLSTTLKILGIYVDLET